MSSISRLLPPPFIHSARCSTNTSFRLSPLFSTQHGTAGSLGFLKHGLSLINSFLVEQKPENTMHSVCIRYVKESVD